MNRKTPFMIVTAALLLALAVAMFCVSGTDSSDAGCPPSEPIFGEGPYPDNDGMRAFGMPAPFGGPAPEEPPRYVIDAPDRPDQRPDRIIDDYGRMYDEKRALEEGGAEVYIFDPELERDAGPELARAITEVFDGAVVSEMPNGAKTIPGNQSGRYDIEFLNLLMEKTEEGSWLRELLSVMLSQYASTESEGVAPSAGREDIPEVHPELIREGGDENESVFFIDDLPEFTPSSEAYLVEHGFDGGTFF